MQAKMQHECLVPSTDDSNSTAVPENMRNSCNLTNAMSYETDNSNSSFSDTDSVASNPSTSQTYTDGSSSSLEVDEKRNKNSEGLSHCTIEIANCTNTTIVPG